MPELARIGYFLEILGSKTFKLVKIEEQTTSTENNKEVMLEDGLEDVENLYTEQLGKHNTKIKTLRRVFLNETCIYTVELPTSEDWRPEVKVEKKAEIKNLQDYETFIEVKDEGQARVGSRWVLTKKEKHDSQKIKVKAGLVTRGFQETLKPQSDSPMAPKELFKLLMALSANFHFKIASVNIRAAKFGTEKFMWNLRQT